MNKVFYPKLALNNIKQNSRMYFPYILTCIGTIAMFYNMCFLAAAKNMGNLSERQELRYILFLGAIVIGIFSVIFLFYTNSFLIKQRKKEFGLFNILGMEKKHIAKIMFFETLYIGLLSLVSGALAGIILSKLIILLLFKILSFKAVFGFEIPVSAIVYTIAVFGGIFLINLIYNFFQVHMAKPVELLKGGNVGEKEPKTKWILALLGVICLGIGYYIALTTEAPLAALNLFFIAVILVIAGTHLLFTAGSIALLKMLRKNKKYYYKTRHFISVSGMIYRMKQNAAGLANICILSTAVIIMISTTVSLYMGVEDALRTRFPRNIIVSAASISDEGVKKLDSVIKEQTDLAKVTPINISRYRTMEFTTNQNDTSFTAAKDTSYNSNKFAMLSFFTLDDYNKMENRNETLSGDEALIYTLRGKNPGNTIDLNGFKLSVKGNVASFGTDGETSAILGNSYYIVVNNVDTIRQISKALKGSDGNMELSYYYGFDLKESKETQINLVSALNKIVVNYGEKCYAQGAESSREGFYSLYGGLFFLGLFLGLLFIMATVLIIYYKQIAEGYDDKERFRIMQKVGMSHAEIKKTIRSQVLTVFFLPLVTTMIHIAVSFKLITRLLSLFNLTNTALFAACTGITILVFSIFYIAVYALTARVYYKIVS